MTDDPAWAKADARTDFELWAQRDVGYPFPLELARMPKGEYKYQDTRFAWIAWQAALRHAEAEMERLGEECRAKENDLLRLEKEKRTYCHLCSEYFIGQPDNHGLGECVPLCMKCMSNPTEVEMEFCKGCQVANAAEARVRELEAQRTCREEFVRMLANFSVGNGDVCELIARRIRAMLAGECNCGADRTGPTAEAHAEWCEAKARAALAGEGKK